MKQAITYEVLFFTNSRFSEKHICKKKCDKDFSTCPLQFRHVVTQAKLLLKLLENCNAPESQTALPAKAHPAKNFIQLNIGDACPGEDHKAISPYSFLPLTNFN